MPRCGMASPPETWRGDPDLFSPLSLVGEVLDGLGIAGRRSGARDDVMEYGGGPWM